SSQGPRRRRALLPPEHPPRLPQAGPHRLEPPQRELPRPAPPQPAPPQPGAPRPGALPARSARSSLRLPSGPQLVLEIDSALLRHRQQTSDVAADLGDARRVLELARGVLEPQGELLLA